MHVAMIGTRGVPAQYGGFETAIEEVGSRLVTRGHQVTVYCRNPGQSAQEYLGMKLVHLPALRRRSLETLTHSALSVAHAMRRVPDIAIVFNSANSPLLPILTLRGIPVAIHVDGLEWKRAKWAGYGAHYYRYAEKRAAKSGAALISDAQGIADYLFDTYGRTSYFIPYGAPILHPGSDKLREVGLTPDAYHLVVARLEPENHAHLIVDGYRRSNSRLPLAVIGSAPYQDKYIKQLRRLAEDSSVMFYGSVWDQSLLNQLYANARSYLHGHSVGGTNPSLLRAMGCGSPITAFDVNFNREVTGLNARFFATAEQVAEAIGSDDSDSTSARQRGEAGQQFVASTYRWEDVAGRYERMLEAIVNGTDSPLPPQISDDSA